MRGRQRRASVPSIDSGQALARQAVDVRGRTTDQAAKASGMISSGDSQGRNAPNEANRRRRPERSRTDPKRRFPAANKGSGAKHSQSGRPGRPRSEVHSTTLRTAAPISNLRLSLAERATAVSSFMQSKANFSRDRIALTLSILDTYANTSRWALAEAKPIQSQFGGWRDWAKRIAGLGRADRMGGRYETIPSTPVCETHPAFGVPIKCEWL